MTPADLETRYRAYLAVLNERRLDDLVHHVRDELTYNGEPMTRGQHRDGRIAAVSSLIDRAAIAAQLRP